MNFKTRYAEYRGRNHPPYRSFILALTWPQLFLLATILGIIGSLLVPLHHVGGCS
jgi:hypothetical protein